MMTRRTDPRFPPVSHMDGVEVRRLGPSGKAHLNKWGLCLTALAELGRRRREFDSILVCGYRVLGIPAMTIGRLLGIPCILKADSLGEFSGAFFDPGLGKLGLSHERLPVSAALRIRNRLFRRAAAFVSVSGAVREELIAGGIPGDRIHDIPNSVDVRAYQPADPEHEFADILKKEVDRLDAVVSRYLSFAGPSGDSAAEAGRMNR